MSQLAKPRDSPTCIHYTPSLCHGNDPRSSPRCDSLLQEGLIGAGSDSVQSVLPSQVACRIQVVPPRLDVAFGCGHMRRQRT